MFKLYKKINNCCYNSIANYLNFIKKINIFFFFVIFSVFLTFILIWPSMLNLVNFNSYTIHYSIQNTLIDLKINNLYYFQTTAKYFLSGGWVCVDYSSSDLDLEKELGSYEWHNILRSEIDNLTSISVDLAIKYGNDYMGGLVNDKLNNSRQVYYRGVEQELSFQIPFSGLKNQIDFNLNFNFDNDFSLNS